MMDPRVRAVLVCVLAVTSVEGIGRRMAGRQHGSLRAGIKRVGLCPNTTSCSRCIMAEHCGWCESPTGGSCVHGGELSAFEEPDTCSCWRYSECANSASNCASTSMDEPTEQDFQGRLDVYTKDHDYATAVRMQMEDAEAHINDKLTTFTNLETSCTGSITALQQAATTATAGIAPAKTQLDEAKAAKDTADQAAMQAAHALKTATTDTAQMQTAADAANTEKNTKTTTYEEKFAAHQAARNMASDAEKALRDKTKLCEKHKLQKERLQAMSAKMATETKLRKAVEAARERDQQAVQGFLSPAAGTQRGQLFPAGLITGMPLMAEVVAP